MVVTAAEYNGRRRRAVPPKIVVRIVGALQRLLLRMADRLVPAHIAVVEHAHRFTATHLLGALAELGIADQLATGPKTAEELAVFVDGDADALHRALRAAAVVGIVRARRDGRFQETRLTRPLRSGHATAAGDWCRYVASPAVQAAWADLACSLRTGDGAFRRVHGTDMFSWFQAHPDEGHRFSAGLGGLTGTEAPMILSAYPFPEVGVVCDVAGGTGVLLAAILQARPQLRGILVESPSVLPEAAAWLEAKGLTGRVELVHGDIFRTLTATADVYLLKWILHDWDDAACLGVVKNVVAAMPTGSRLLVIEGDQPRHRPHPRFSMIDLQMLAVTEGGRERSAAEITGILEQAGLRPTSVRHTATDLALIEAIAG